MAQEFVIDNSNLLQMCHDCGAVGFIPVLTYAFDAGAETVTVTDGSTLPDGDTLTKIKVRVNDFFGGTVVGEIAALAGNVVIDVSDLNLSKPIALTATIITDGGIIADGGAYGLMPAGDVAHWDIQKRQPV